MSLGFQSARLVKTTSQDGMDDTPMSPRSVSGQLEPLTENTPDAATCHTNLNHNHTKNQQQAFQHKPMAKSLEEMLKMKWHALTERTQSRERL